MKTSILPEYKERLYRDEQGAVWMRNVYLSDEAKYVIQYETDNNFKKSEVRIDVMVAPKKNCKPKIVRKDSFLTASLVAEDCGRPVASVYWKDINDNVYRSNTEIKLQPENRDVLYIACIDGPALLCEKALENRNYCSSINIDGIKNATDEHLLYQVTLSLNYFDHPTKEISLAKISKL
ncbi:hypothetical protein CHS0354_025626 [Potamilus streckersoni]|uniref:Uncharacterized protein n=1 Tax=Potamilus streckersoni TaxID=2493646 RepID=A0AAE0S1R9_9BIVA|nr:hypothetical protein CHS0354_025626 [Potamilus streckersoni]